MSDKSYRIKANVGEDTVLRVPLKQDIDFLEILSLKISQSGIYRLHSSNYGVVVGRVLANGGFGIPNAKLSIFVPISNEDFMNSDLGQSYPYTHILATDGSSRRYNLLRSDSSDDCYRIVGTFPNKRYVLDNDNQIEIFDKYWKYTTVTNASGDYMIFGVPTGNQTLHVDIDLSDIGILSQKPIDMIYNGYNINSFENPYQFKSSTNLDNLVQIYSQNTALEVFPFWGDSSEGEIAITRADIQIQYEFNTTCVFMGGIVTDDQNASIGHNCTPHKKIGTNRSFNASEGTIEMIRKTQDGLVEEFQIQGNQLIDGDGVWCYQIPMNLDYMITDEFGNMVPTDNPTKGIATRTSVRFRFSINETGGEGFSRHRAEYLVPNNPKFKKISQENGFNSSTKPLLATTWSKTINSIYQFGSNTPDDCFRDLYWNKVYSVKNYIPRIQATKSRSTKKYTGLRSVNFNDSMSPAPFNNVRFQFPFSYMFLCILMEIFFVVAAIMNAIICLIRCIPIGIPIKVFGVWLCWFPFKDLLPCITMEIENDESPDGEMKTYAPGCWFDPPRGADIGHMGEYTDRMQRSLAQESEVVNFDFNNDWINGCLYFPLWFWKKTKKKKYLFGLITIKPKSLYCSGNSKIKKLYLSQACAVKYMGSGNADQWATRIQNKFTNVKLYYGLIYEHINKDGFSLYYYAPIDTDSSLQFSENLKYYRLFATDIILLGSLKDCDIDGIPKAFENIPASSSNLPDLVSNYDEDETTGEVFPSITGLDWTRKKGNPPYKYAKGLLLDLSCTNAGTLHKSIVNTRRLCELGVSLDSTRLKGIPSNSSLRYSEILPDGLVTRYELDDNNSRAMFATLNHNGLDKTKYNSETKYTTYDLRYIYPVDFDGDLDQVAKSYTRNQTYDNQDVNYLYYRYGYNTAVQYNDTFPLFNNSFYFYFGAKQGKTAMEKFRTNYYGTCYDNTQYSFGLETVVTAGTWCSQEAHAKITCSKIKTPYSLKIIDSIGIEFITLINLEYETVNISYSQKMPSSPIGTQDEDNGDFENEGFCTYVIEPQNDEEGKYEVYSSDFTNGSYTLKIIDSYGRVTEEPLQILQTPLSLEIATTNLSVEYTVGSLVDDASSGKIIINSFELDGDGYCFKNNSATKVDDNTWTIDGYKVVNDAKADGYDWDKPQSTATTITVEIIPSNNSQDPRIGTFYDTLTEKTPLYENILSANTEDTTYGTYWTGTDIQPVSIVFNVGTSDTFFIRAVHRCEGVADDENDNIFESNVSIANGEPLVLLLNEIDTSILKPMNSLNDSLDRWVNIANPNQYIFPNCGGTNDEWWSTYVNNYREVQNNEINKSLDVLYPTTENATDQDADAKAAVANNMLNVIKYKFDSICAFAATSMLGESQVQVPYAAQGASKPTLYAAYPDYQSISNSATSANRHKVFQYSDNDSTILSNLYHPTVISSNYYILPTTISSAEAVGSTYKFNGIFNGYSQALGNYASAIDLNNEKICMPTNVQKLPKLGTFPAISADDVKNYFVNQIVDRRIDHCFYIFKDSSKGLVRIDSKRSKLFNGIALAYNGDNKEMISKSSDSYSADTEYSYSLTYENNKNLTLNTNLIPKSRKYFKVQFRTETESQDVTTAMTETNASTLQMPQFTFNKDIELTGITVFNWEITPCSFKNLKAVVSDDKTSLSCPIAEGSPYEGGIDIISSFVTPFSSMSEMAERDFYNIEFHKNNNTKVASIRLRKSIGLDESLSNGIFTNAPILVPSPSAASKPTIDTIINAYASGNLRYTSLELSDDIIDDYKSITTGNNRGKYVARRRDVSNSYSSFLSGIRQGERLPDDDEIRSNVTYRFSIPSSSQNYYLAVEREYLSGMFGTSHIARRSYVYEVGEFIDKRVFSDNACGNVIIDGVGSITWFGYCNNYNCDMVPPKDETRSSKYHSFVIISIPKSNREVVMDDEGNPQLVVKIGNTIYSNIYSNNNSSFYRFLVPFFSMSVGSTENASGTEEEDPNVSPIWYRRPNVYVYVRIKQHGSDLIYKFRRKF